MMKDYGEIFFGEVGKKDPDTDSARSYFVLHRIYLSQNESKVKDIFVEVNKNFVKSYLEGATFEKDLESLGLYNGILSEDSLNKYSSLCFLPVDRERLEDLISDLPEMFKEKVIPLKSENIVSS
ncbi:MAG: hypothetical protein WDZ69_02985 [Candidatus Pacearchaeota archaeon]